MMLKQPLPLVFRKTTALAAFCATALLSVAAPSAQSVSAPLTITTFAGAAGQPESTSGVGTAARFYHPAALALDSAGNLYVADASNNIVRKITPGGAVTVFASTPVDPLNNLPINIGSADGTGTAARFYMGSPEISGRPITLGIDSAGSLYLADTLNSTLRKITAGAVVTTPAGSAGNMGTDDGTGAAARFYVPTGAAADASGNVYVADSAKNTIRKVTPAGVVTTFAGSASSFGKVDGTGTDARFNGPRGIAIDSAGNLYVTDTGNHTIRKITAAGVVTTIAGSGGVSGTADGVGTAARFNAPTGIAVDGSGNLYVADKNNHAIRKITSDGTVSTIAGTKGTSGTTDGTGTNALFLEPSGIAVDAAGSVVYIADTGNHTIRKGVVDSSAGSLEVTAVPPALVQVRSGTNVTLKITATGSPSPTYQWYRDTTAIAGATNASYTIGSATQADMANYSVTVTSNLVTYTSSPTNVQVFESHVTVPGITLVSVPIGRTVAAGQGVTFAVEAASASPMTYQWTLNGTPIVGATGASYTVSSATLDSAGAYAVIISNGTESVTTTSVTLTVTGVTAVAPQITAQPESVSVATGGTATFRVTATGTPTPVYRWSKDGVALSDSATVSGSATATLTISQAAAADAGAYRVAVSNSAGSMTSNAATLTVTTATIPPARIVNMSVLTSIAAGEDFYFGYYVGGKNTSGNSPILMRALGPTLSDPRLGVSNPLPDPYAEAYDGGDKVAQNDNWGGSSTIVDVGASVWAFPLIATNSKDAAIYQPVVSPATGHSLRVSGAAGNTGMVLAELYETTPDSSYVAGKTKLVNVSVRKSIGGQTTLGFTIGGPASKTVKVLIRAVGPRLAEPPFSLQGTIVDPMLIVYRTSDQAEIARNDNWTASAEMTAALTATYAFGLDTGSKDAAIILTLPPGGYTATVSPVSGTATGLGLIELYEIEP
ncbi:immunoglobulin domain-containing protein [Opitutus sp. ER46]|uniref:immunoglobulin domain-containing protein n=1 Tax=Opitutus sp. ER46 TaxID=2161864 RepID=UPI000D2FE655|nr:immunoglobulin domain-containing protein [Opitutus sp. ER46]PTX94320.1 hypothetical protein DB354_11200 [Opitutus sp. ER46]